MDYKKLDLTPCNDHECENRTTCLRYTIEKRETAIAWPATVDRSVPCHLYWPMLRLVAQQPYDEKKP